MLPFTRALLVGLLSIATSAWAYIPPASFILHEVAKKHTGFSTIRVRSNLLVLDENGNPTGARLRETTFVNSRDQSLRSWITDDSGKVLYSVERFMSGPKSAKTPVVAEILFDSNSARVAAALKSVGIQVPRGKEANVAGESPEVGMLSLRRWNRSVAWVLGKNAQLWIEKDTFEPVRIIAPPRGDSRNFDFQMENFRRYDEFSYPRLGTLYETGKKNPILKAELVDVVLDPSGTASEVPKDKTEGFTEAGQSASSQVRDLIETYYRLIR